MKPTINTNQSELDEIGLSIDQIKEAATNALSKLDSPNNGNTIYFNAVHIEVVTESTKNDGLFQENNSLPISIVKRFAIGGAFILTAYAIILLIYKFNKYIPHITLIILIFALAYAVGGLIIGYFNTTK